MKMKTRPMSWGGRRPGGVSERIGGEVGATGWWQEEIGRRRAGEMKIRFETKGARKSIKDTPLTRNGGTMARRKKEYRKVGEESFFLEGEGVGQVVLSLLGPLVFPCLLSHHCES
jgi:hypothetical protein